MPNRILKESVCTSPTLNQLNFGEEVFFYRLLVQCDDYGRFDAHPAILRSRCFPLRIQRVTERMVEEWLSRFVELGLIQLYEAGGRPLLQVSKWDRHQQVRAQASKYPQPPAGDINGQQAIVDAPVFEFV